MSTFCEYCPDDVRAVAICKRCGASICEDHTTPDGECSDGPEGDDLPLHGPGDLTGDEARTLDQQDRDFAEVVESYYRAGIIW